MISKTGEVRATGALVAVRCSVVALMASLTVWVAAAQEAPEEMAVSAGEEHEALFSENRFPSATTCGNCHPTHYRQWSVSPHAYSQMSPVFNAMHGTILKLSNGTNGDFCIRCHTPVGMNLERAEFMSNMDRHPTSREGVTCIVCHRVNKAYGKLSGRLAIIEGDHLRADLRPDRQRRGGAGHRVAASTGSIPSGAAPGSAIHRPRRAVLHADDQSGFLRQLP